MDEAPNMDNYYFSNWFWITFNKILIVPFLISCANRFFNQDVKKDLWTDYIARIFLFISWTFYFFDIYIKYPIDGSDSICEKAFFAHHISSLIILPPLFLNKHIAWWICPIGFMHGFCLAFPELQFLNYIYAACLFIFHYGIYQEPYCNLRGYKLSQYFMNFIWVFCLMLLVGNCSNYLPVGPDP